MMLSSLPSIFGAELGGEIASRFENRIFRPIDQAIFREPVSGCREALRGRRKWKMIRENGETLAQDEEWAESPDARVVLKMQK
jgi:hypothetical protein